MSTIINIPTVNTRVYNASLLQWENAKQAVLEAGNVTVSGTVSLNQTGTANDVDIGGVVPIAGRLPIDGSGVTQPISAASLPLPTGASTQTTLASCLTELQSILTKLNASIAVTGTFWQATQPISGTVTANAGTNLNTSALALEAGGNLATAVSRLAVPYATRSDTFTATGNGTAINASTAPISQFGLQVVGTGGTPTLWQVVLEGSLDGTNFTTILSHTTSLGIAVTLWSGASFYPSLYIRARCVVLTLGPATNIVTTIIGLR